MKHRFISVLPISMLILLQACSPAQQSADSSNSTDSANSAGTTETATANSEVASLLATLSTDNDPEEKTFQSLDGRGFDIDLFAGQKVFINYWATWCAPCIREIPSINRATATLAPEGYVFLFASDESVDTITQFLDERPFEGNFIKLNGFFGSYGIGAVPSSWLIDENGEVLKTWAGAYEWDNEEMLAEIRN